MTMKFLGFLHIVVNILYWVTSNKVPVKSVNVCGLEITAEFNLVSM